MSPPPSQDIPVDVFYAILLRCGVRVKDLCFLWLNCRPVSRKCKDAVEHVFVTKHLNKTWLRFDPKPIKTRNGTNDHHGSDVEFQFYCLDPADSARAIFESYKYKNGIEEVLRIGPSLERPNMIIQIRHQLNDTVLPDFRYLSDSNFDLKLEVSFDWKGMYCHFFRELREVQGRLDERRGVIVPRMTLSLLESRISRDVRGERIRRNVWEKEGRQVYGDYPGFDELEKKRSFAECEDRIVMRVRQTGMRPMRPEVGDSGVFSKEWI